MSDPRVEVDRSVPALVAKLGHYPRHFGGVGAIRSLGRLGVPVYAITENRWTPAAVSRYLQDRFVWPTTGLERPELLIEGLLDIGRRIGRPTVLIPTDDEAAVLIAEHADVLRETFIAPQVAHDLPRRLASKRGLAELCRQHGVPTPKAAYPRNLADLDDAMAEVGFPLVVKHLEAFERRRSDLAKVAVVDDADQLRRLAPDWGEKFSVVVQEYLPPADTEDWMADFYCDSSSDSLVGFTGVKVRSWPAHAGVTTCAYSVANPELAEMTARFAKSIGFQGIADLDWRYSHSAGEYRLLDFNPRVGAQFRMFETEAGIDVIRALHLDLTGRSVPSSPQIDGRRLLDENLDPAARFAYRHSPSTTPSVPAKPSSTELAWLARDDIKPFFAMVVEFMGAVRRRLVQFWRSRARRRPSTSV